MLANGMRALARAALILCLSGPASAALQVELVRNICPGSCDGVEVSSWQSYVATSGKLFFRSASDIGANIWATDGTAAGTVQLHDTTPILNNPMHTRLVRVGERVYFGGTDDTERWRLFESDGTPAGTRHVPLFNDADPVPYYPNAITDWNGEAWLERSGVIFRIPAAGAAAQPMATLYMDFTPDPMVPLGDVLVAAGRSCRGCPEKTKAWRLRADGGIAPILDIPEAPVMTVHAGPGGVIVHVQRENPLTSELWIVRPGGSVTKIHDQVSDFSFVAHSVHGGRFWFTDGDLYQPQLFSTDGTAAGTRKETDLPPQSHQPQDFLLTTYHDQLYATARFGFYDGSFVRLDASHPQGARQVRRVFAVVAPSVRSFVLHADRMFFSVARDLGPTELWSSDGTPGGTQRVTLPRPPGTTERAYYPIAEWNGWLYFLRETDSEGTELWRLRGNASDFPALATQHVVEYYNPPRDHYFMTGKPDEIAGLDAGVFAGWQRTGEGFTAYAPGASDPEAVPVCRFYGLPSAGLDSHFYSSYLEECQDIVARFSGAWFLETMETFDVAQAWPDGACPTGFVPLYRTFNQRSDINHRYTTDAAIQTQMAASGWRREGFGPGVAMCVLARDGGQ